MSRFQKHLDDEALIVAAIKNGTLVQLRDVTPDDHIETGLAHVFFYGDVVYKQYKIVGDDAHFIKGVLAPTPERHDFIVRDFTLNQHFSGGVYRSLHGYMFENAEVHLRPYGQDTPHVGYEMERLDFSQNFHEQLLKGEVSYEQLYELGYFTAKAVAESPINAPPELNWYELAQKRLAFLRQFIAWLPDRYREAMEASACVAALSKHLDDHRSLYESITGKDMTVALDNHDENIFLRESGPVFIDVVPPMESWWYGPAVVNLANIVVNVETLKGHTAAEEVERGFMAYHTIDVLPEPEYSFAKALAYVISAVHFSSIPEKSAIGEQYINACRQIGAWL
ncbi:MAG TPA: hypothetical protein VGE31_01645 [Candidatus Paceibacterota bacterium]